MYRPRTMRWRIASAYIFLIVGILALLSLVLLQLLHTTYLRTFEDGLAGQARLLATIAGDRPSPSLTLTTMVGRLHNELGARVTLIAADGTVLADSLQAPAANGNLLDRPEVRDALALGQGANERNSTATGDEMFYVAVPIGPSNAPTGVARVGAPLTAIAQAQGRLGAAVLAAAMLAIAVALALAVLIARRTTRPLLQLRSMAARLASGDLEAQAPIPPDEEIAALAQDFNRMASRLRRAEQSRRTFLANISHDLRTPLASLQAMIETLQDGALEDQDAAADFLARMDAEVQGLNRLVSEFLELSRIEANAFALHLSPTDLCALLTAVVSRMAAQAQLRGVAIELTLPAALPLLQLDGARIEQALLNLIQNALAFTPRAGVITVAAAMQGDQIAVSVRDTGIGIAPQDLPHIFERFYKTDRARSGGGTGLGLAITKHLIERHGGQIAATSQVGHGTTVTFTLPLAEASRAVGH